MLKVGLIGTGGIYRLAHLEAWKAAIAEGVEIAAVCDANVALATAAQHDFPEAHLHTNYMDLIARDDIDIISITTPNKFHSQIAIEALKHGKHVFCEKPDAINPVEAERMAAVAKDSGKLFMSMRNNRFTAAAQHVKQLLDEGFFGELYAGRCGWIRTRGIPGRGGWFTTKELSGGGPLIDLGVHMIDLAMWLNHDPTPATVSGTTYQKLANLPDANGEAPEGIYDVEDLAMGFIRFTNGASLQLEFSWASNVEREQKFLEWRGTKAGFSIINDELTLYVEQDGQVVAERPELVHGGRAQHEQNIIHFIKCVKGEEQPTITPQEGVHMIQILDAIYRSSEQGSEIKLV